MIARDRIHWTGLWRPCPIGYEKQIAWIRFVGTHPQYDQIDAVTV